ncbi:MAG: PAS domain-containing protein [Deltaproteobacteria bacterium]|nr:PAS domain-containing protein [Deltaproteobacteria bacterium]
MSAFLLVPLLSCIVCAVLATAILAREPSRPANRLGAGLVGGASFWALCEVLWNGQDDPEVALLLVKLASLGWACMGPMALHFFLELTDDYMPRVRRGLPYCYGASALFVLTDWLTPWVHTGVVRTSWGWACEFGPVYPFFYTIMMGCVAAGLFLCWRAMSGSPSPGEREQTRWLILGFLVPVAVASLTDGLLPIAGVQLPRFGTASFAVLGVVILWIFRRHGYSLLAPGVFASEILETLPEGVAMVGLDGRIRSANDALAALLGARPKNLRGLRLSDRLSEPIHPTEDAMERQCELVTLNDRRVPVAISSTVLRDHSGCDVGLVLVVRDLGEVVALRDRLMLSGRLAAVGELAAGIAHEISNPLAFVRANLSLMREHWSSLGEQLEKGGMKRDASDLLAEGEEMLDESLEGVDRAAAIVRDVRGLAHAGGRERQAADLNQLLEGVLRIAAPQLRGRATLEKEFGDVPPVWGTPQELQQVFLNLVLNALQALGESGTIRIATGKQGEFVFARVEDDGCGMEPEIRERIFDPFFTTKPVGEGTGLGLGIAYGIIRNHGGDISVESEPGRGSRFCVQLPVAADTIEAS